MYKRLTKITTCQDGRECVSCVDFGTVRCRIHNNVPDCAHCPVFGAILNQLCAFEDVMCQQCKNVCSDNIEQI